MNGNVFKIQRFCTDDGPGIRTTVFLKGCNMSCKWCHNPEGIHSQPEFQYFQEKCTNCGACAAVCLAGARRFVNNMLSFDKNLCIFCKACINSCPNNALILTGEKC